MKTYLQLYSHAAADRAAHGGTVPGVAVQGDLALLLVPGSNNGTPYLRALHYRLEIRDDASKAPRKIPVSKASFKKEIELLAVGAQTTTTPDGAVDIGVTDPSVVMARALAREMGLKVPRRRLKVVAAANVNQMALF